ncbi:TPA: hypothetical protein OZ525_001246, partial [Escherichia coli]|nr:hypothetical protein [Escherichia coli]
MRVIIRALSAQAEKERVKRENKRRFARRVDCIRVFITPKTREQLERMKQEHDQLFDRREDCRQAFMKTLKDKAEAVGAIPLVRYFHALNLLKVECRKRIKEQRKWAAFRAAQRPVDMDKIAMICAKADAEKKLRDLAVAEAAQRRLIAELEAKTRLKLLDMAFTLSRHYLRLLEMPQRPPEITTSSINHPSLSTCSSSNQTAAQSDTGSEEGYQFCEENEMGKRKNKHRHQNKTRQAVIIPERVKVVDRNVQATPVTAPHDAVNDFMNWCDTQQHDEPEETPDYGEYQDYANVISAEEQQQAAEAAAEALATPEPPPVQTREEAIAFFYQRQKLFQEQTRKEDEEAKQRRKDAQAAAEAAKLQELDVPENPQPVPRPEPVKRKMSEDFRRACLVGLKKNHPDIYARAIADPDMTVEEAWKLAGQDLSKPAEYKPRQADPKATAEAEAYGPDRGYTPGYAMPLNTGRRRMVNEELQRIRAGKPEQEAPEDPPEEPAPLPEEPAPEPQAPEAPPTQEDKERGRQNLNKIRTEFARKAEYSRTVENASQYSANNADAEQQKEAARQRYYQWQQQRQQQRGPWNFKQE